MFQLDSRLEKSSDFIAELSLSQLRLVDNKDYVWLLLMPRVCNARELIDLSEKDSILLNQEIRQISVLQKKVFQPYKLNIASIGNVVEQLHIHVIGRNKDDNLYPAPVWGSEAEEYDVNKKKSIIQEIQNYLETQRSIQKNKL